jgi:hypothetical protein
LDWVVALHQQDGDQLRYAGTPDDGADGVVHKRRYLVFVEQRRCFGVEIRLGHQRRNVGNPSCKVFL